MEKLFETILKIDENIKKDEAPKVGFDLDDGWYGLDGKYKKFVKPKACYHMKNNFPDFSEQF